ncbi:MAG: Glyceraldehyde-3-phosphate dehydrogenase [Candidatus Berkelbacteria bacterium Licking1014_7]|uniref:Glyceraldehyde-3-phosphate dehydrogenase n=1 Tax=Candidatus Berkelbacteria bacterium Licking1014_7 TaxID=2017147 RepID=A0A554LI84_9BACT|nr:MAG: Glyceraldehyde-3-phosphate dehydrogenase [Candidatus Berkelbacteria bacterium Licking1014_7]
MLKKWRAEKERNNKMNQKIKLAINGFGRIGRSAFKIAFEKFSDQIEIVGINDLADNVTLAALLNHDSNYGPWKYRAQADDQNLIIEGKKILALAEKDPSRLPWKKLGVDVVLECTGVFTEKKQAGLHIKAGAKKVIISAPSKGDNPAPTYVLGVNETDDEDIINNGSCTTNCISPIMKVLEENLGVEKAFMTTVHAYTADQSLQDAPHQDLHRARAATENIVPTTTGAGQATIETIPSLKSKFDGMAIRVPVPVGSISDITALVKRDTTVEELNEIFVQASKEKRFQGILTTTDEPIVSTDIIGSSYSAIVDLGLTRVVAGNLVKIFAWYDNEYGYSTRLVEQAMIIGKKN